MMNGRGYNGRGFNGFSGNNGCFGYGFMNNGWNMLIVVGVFLAIALLIYFLVHNRKKVISNQSTVEILKMKYVQGEITEEEYLKRKNVLDRS